MMKSIKIELIKLISINLGWFGLFTFLILNISDIEILRAFLIVTFFLLCLSQVIFNICTNPLFKGE
jgi:succinate-acetate transporter protein